MQIPQSTIQDEVWVKILPKGLITLPKKMRDILDIKAGDVVRVNISGNSIIIKPRKSIGYRLFTDKEIKQWAKDDKLPEKLQKKFAKILEIQVK